MTRARVDDPNHYISKERTVAFNPGDRVSHSQFGDGTLVSANEYHTVVAFDTNGLRTFSSPRVVLTSSSTPAPEKPVKRRKTAERKSPGGRA